MTNDYTIIAKAYNAQARIYISTTKELVQKAKTTHNTWPTASAAMGRLLTVSSIYGLMQKDPNAKLTIRVDGDGPIGKMLVETNSSGNVRSTIENPSVYLVYNSGPNKDKLNVGMAVGNGFIHITKDLGLKDVYNSSSVLQTGEIAEDFTYFFTVSEQTPSVVSLGVLVGPDQNILQSGGFVIQLMPDATEETIVKIEDMLKTLPSMTQMLSSDLTLEDILHKISCGTAIILDTKTIKYECNCSREKMEKTLTSLDIDTLTLLKNEDKGAELICHFCHTKYFFNEQDLQKIIDKKNLKKS